MSSTAFSFKTGLAAWLFFCIAAGSMAGCSKQTEIDAPRGRFVPMKDLVQGAPTGSDAILRPSSLMAGPGSVLSGASTTPTMAEVLDRIEAALEGVIKRTNRGAEIIPYLGSITQAKPSLMASRDPADLTAGSAFAIVQLIHGACGSLREPQWAAFGVTITQPIATQAANLKAFGLRLFSNATLITPSSAPALYAQAGAVFDAQIAKLKVANYGGYPRPTEAAGVSICTSAIHAGAFRSGS